MSPKRIQFKLVKWELRPSAGPGRGGQAVCRVKKFGNHTYRKLSNVSHTPITRFTFYSWEKILQAKSSLYVTCTINIMRLSY
jgi:hypothetical protein